MDLNPTKTPRDERTATTNYEGGPAFEADTPQMGLFVATTGTLIESQFYRDATEQLDHLRYATQKAADAEPEFAVQMAAYARDVMNLRDAPQVMLVDLAHHPDAKRYVRAYAPKIIQRADEPATILGVWNKLYNNAEPGDPFPSGVTLPKPLKKGINDALEEFNAYHFAKYTSDRRVYNLRDVFNMTRPKASSPERQDLHDRLMWGELDEYPDVDPLPAPVTWEVIKSAAGQDGEDSAEAWATALPYMGMYARIRNIRNMLDAGIPGEDIVNTPMKGVEYEAGDDDLVAKVKHGEATEFVIDENGMTMDEVRRRKLYPFRFYRAYTAMQGKSLRDRQGGGYVGSGTPLRPSEAENGDLYDPDVADFLGEAIDTAAENLDDRMGQTLVAVDLSGSMRHAISKHSTVSYKEIGALFGAALARKGATVWAYADSVEPVKVHHRTPTLQIMDAVMAMDSEVGGSTYAWKVPAIMNRDGIEVDRLVFMTDEQSYAKRGRFHRSGGEDQNVRAQWHQYQRDINPDANVYTVDLSGYATLQFPEGEAYYIGGWSENVLDYIGYAERPSATIEKVRQTPPANTEHLPEDDG